VVVNEITRGRYWWLSARRMLARLAGGALLPLPPQRSALVQPRRPIHGGETEMRLRGRLAGPAMGQAVFDCPRSELRPVWMLDLEPLVLADLPVDLVVVLEQQERAGKAKRADRALPDRRCSRRREHVFVR
jgi:hypothetical protein